MNHPGVWIMGDTADDDRNHGMGIVVEYANRTGKAQWISPPASKWNYAHFGNSSKPAQDPDETFDMTFTKVNAADQGFNRWEINGVAYPNTMAMAPLLFTLERASATGSGCGMPVTTFTRSTCTGTLSTHQCRRTKKGWRLERRHDGGWVSGSRSRLCCERPRPNLVPLPPAATHGLRVHDAV
jgi:hypothetical protein